VSIVTILARKEKGTVRLVDGKVLCDHPDPEIRSAVCQFYESKREMRIATGPGLDQDRLAKVRATDDPELFRARTMELRGEFIGGLDIEVIWSESTF